MLTGTGTAGAYHAGVLKALQEAGVKIDIVAGRGIGAASATFAAIDAGEQLWGAAGSWSTETAARFYRWRWTLRLGVLALGLALGALLVPLTVLVGGLALFPAGFVLQLFGLETGGWLAVQYAGLVEALFDPGGLPLYLPRFVTVMLLLLLGVLSVGAVIVWLRARLRRRARGGLWWELLGSPLDQSLATKTLARKLWTVVCGSGSAARPDATELGERYAQLLAENTGQPGFRDLLLLVHDLDARRDFVAALLSEPFRRSFFLRRQGDDAAERHLETLDLADTGRRQLMDMLAASLSLPVATEPHLTRFPDESAWQGETHRLCDRPESTVRLLEEVANAGAEQVILVSACGWPSEPGRLTSGRRDPLGRVGESLVAVESASIRDALALPSRLFEVVFQIRPTHNPLGPFDFNGSYDELSDRRHTLAELVSRGYEDAFSQFVNSVVGASGEWIDSR
ncbi:MAG: hypothetical protein J4F30_03720 [Acidobacteria bacterium]|nr:hypothetical protein [Acidobacteriota bacterium]